MSWSLVSNAPSTGKVYSRPLALNERSFYFDRIFNGTADIIWHHTVQQTDNASGAGLFSEENVKRAWLTLKQWYPLYGAQMDDSDGGDMVKFVVSEQALASCHPDEVTVKTVSSSAEVNAVVDKLMRVSPMGDHHLMSRVLVFPRKDSPGTCEFLFRAAHAIADGISGATVGRTFFDALTSPPTPPPSLEERLAMALPYTELNPTKKMSLARQRWRRATARIIYLNRRSRLAGGHTVPNMVTNKSYRTPSTTNRHGCRFTLAESNAILATCRAHHVTFGTAISVISQLAITRILHRRFLRGDLPLAEWEYRRRQPMYFGGPVNLRPYMDPDWKRAGGATEIALHIDFYEGALPVMPTPFGTRTDAGVPRVGGAPPFAALMSHPRFFLRVHSFKRQLQRIVRNPLVLDISAARQPGYVARKKRIAGHWMADKKGEPHPEIAMEPWWDSVPADYVPSNGLSSVGQMSLIFPERYPLPPNHPLSVRTPRPANPTFATVSEGSPTAATIIAPPVTSEKNTLLQAVNMITHLHSRPMEFFLGNATEHDHIVLNLMYDANVYSKDVVEEFIEECRQATLHYLGGASEVRGKL